jgi:hypothetical protein
LEIADALARKVDAGSRPHCKIRWGTEATIQDTLKMREHLSLFRKAGLWALWLGVEDMSGALVKKGQDEARTVEAFRLLRQDGIFPVPMLMHHDAQPLYTWRGNQGLLNQMGTLRKAGALYMQVLMLTPSPGSKSYDHAFTAGLAYKSVNGVPVDPSMKSGVHVIASRHPRPWIKQLNILAAYLYFFNPLRFLFALVCPKSRIPLADAETWPPAAAGQPGPRRNGFKRWLRRQLKAHVGDAVVQAFGMWGLVQTFRRTLGWTYHLMRGQVERHTTAPASPISLRHTVDCPACRRSIGSVSLAIAGSEGRGRDRLLPLPGEEGRDQDEEQGDEDQVDERGREHSAGDRGSDGVHGAGPGSDGDGQRQRAEEEGQRGHDDRTESDSHGREGRLDESFSLTPLFLDELNDQDGVLGR